MCVKSNSVFFLKRNRKVTEKETAQEIRSTRVINSFTDKELLSGSRLQISLLISFDRLNYTSWMHIPEGCLGTRGEKKKKKAEHIRAPTQAHTVEWLELQTSAVFSSCEDISRKKKRRDRKNWMNPRKTSAKRKLRSGKAAKQQLTHSALCFMSTTKVTECRKINVINLGAIKYVRIH